MEVRQRAGEKERVMGEVPFGMGNGHWTEMRGQVQGGEKKD